VANGIEARMIQWYPKQSTTAFKLFLVENPIHDLGLAAGFLLLA
jgi:hypothetical protein